MAAQNLLNFLWGTMTARGTVNPWKKPCKGRLVRHACWVEVCLVLNRGRMFVLRVGKKAGTIVVVGSVWGDGESCQQGILPQARSGHDDACFSRKLVDAGSRQCCLVRCYSVRSKCGNLRHSFAPFHPPSRPFA